MKKIISLFKRHYDGDRGVYNEIVEGAEWVANGEGVATRKWDGTSCLIRGGKLYKRFDAKRGKTPPPNFEPAQDPDPITGHHPGWIPVGDGPEDRWHREAWKPEKGIIPDGTYELIGPKINGNRDKATEHMFMAHGDTQYVSCPRTYEEIKDWLADKEIEGVVWHHPDGRMVKIKKKDFKEPSASAEDGEG